MEVGLSSYWNTLRFGEVVNTEVISVYDYGDNDGVRWQPNTWYKVRIDANSRTGTVKVWVDDVSIHAHRPGYTTLRQNRPPQRQFRKRLGQLLPSVAQVESAVSHGYRKTTSAVALVGTALFLRHPTG